MDVDTIMGSIFGALVFIVAEVLAFALSVADRVTGWGGGLAAVTFLVASVVVVFACLVFWRVGLHLLGSMGLWLGWCYVLVAGALTDWIIERIEARSWRGGANSEWTSDWRTGETYARGWTVEDEMLGEQIAEEARVRENEHHLVRALRESREWEMLKCATGRKTRSKMAYKRLAQRFHPDRVRPEDEEAATWCMQEINRIWEELPEK